MLWEEKNKSSALIYFIVPAPLGISPGQRFRFEHYLDLLEERNINYKISSFYSKSGWAALYKGGKLHVKIGIVLSGFCKRVLDLVKIKKYDFVFIFREAAPIGPPVFEYIIARILKKKIIYDFDDAIWIPHTSQFNKIVSYLRWFRKTSVICKYAYKVSVGNEYLASYAMPYNKNVFILPTVVNTEQVHNAMQNQDTNYPNIGWTGTFSTLKYLNIVMPVLQHLQHEYDFTFVVIADRDPKLPLKKYRFIKWNKDTEVEDLLSMHIGLMPLYDDEYSKGKCGFKAIQYMSLGIPALVSPVGVNSLIVDDGINGFTCNDSDEWEQRLRILLTDKELRKKFGLNGKRKIETVYSVNATKNLFLDLFK